MDEAKNNLQYRTFSCTVCDNGFETSEEFAKHLRKSHCNQEGGSFVCRYGDNAVCSSLPVEGVNSIDYERHVYKHHINTNNKYQRHRRHPSSMSASGDYSLEEDKWTLYSASQNLSAVLNNPNKPKQKDFFTKLWGESFAEVTNIPCPAYLPHITPSHFEHYLRKVSKRYRRHSKLNAIANQSNTQNDLIHHFPALKAIKPPEKIASDISDIPSIYLKTKFDLSCPETFATVFPHIQQCNNADFNEIVSDSLHKCAGLSASSKQLQEKLSHYLDIVEVQIAKQVASKSDAFFHTMTSHDTLMEQLGQTVTKVRTLRQKIQKIDGNLVSDSLQVLKGARTRNNCLLVLHKLRIMATVYQTQPTVKLLLSTPDYVAALDLIYTTKDLLNNELAGIHCFRHLSSELNEMINTIDALMVREFDHFAVADLNRPLLESETSVFEVDKLFCIVLGMLRRQCFSFVDSYLRESYATIKAAMKQTVVEIIACSESTELQISKNEFVTLDDQLKMLSIDEWMTLLRNTSSSLCFLLNRIKAETLFELPITRGTE